MNIISPPFKPSTLVNSFPLLLFHALKDYFQHTTVYHRWLRAISIFFNQIYHLLTELIQTFYLLSHALVVEYYYAKKRFLAQKLDMMPGSVKLCQKNVSSSIWDTPTTRRLRQKIVFEFMTFILGAGNNIFLVIFWPGSLLLGATALTIQWVCH